MLEPLESRHIEGLSSASSGDPELYRWSFVPRGAPAVRDYVASAIAARQAGRAMPFAIVRAEDGTVMGSTRFFDLERWAWPAGHASPTAGTWDACELGYTWLGHPYIRTGVNTEAKLLMLAHAFETWRVLRVCLHTDERNARSRAAMERIGARFEGILRAHRNATDHTPRNSARYSITAGEWPQVKGHLRQLLR